MATCVFSAEEISRARSLTIRDEQILREVERAMAPRAEYLDQACRIALDRGWLPSECLVVYGEDSTVTLKVGELDCFRVVVSMVWDQDKLTATIVTTPQMLAPIPWHPRTAST